MPASRKLIDWIRQTHVSRFARAWPAIGRAGTVERHCASSSSPSTTIPSVICTSSFRPPLRAQTEREQRIAIYHGPTPPDEREEIKQAFNADPSKHPLRILIATDAAREGLNLQTHCWNLFHFDVPWNPSRMEQRNGRIDRKLQPKPEVFCHYFVYHQRPEDRILEALVRKTETIKRELGSLAQVIDAQACPDPAATASAATTSRRWKKKSETATSMPNIAQTVEEELEATRERQEQLRSTNRPAANLLEASQREHRPCTKSIFNRPFHAPWKCSAPTADKCLLRIRPAGTDPRDVLPALDQREGADPTWADTMDTLRVPRKRDQEALGMATHLADPPGRLRGFRHDGRRGRPSASGAPRRAATARPLHRSGLRAPRPLPRLSRSDDGRHSARRPAWAALPLRPRAARLHEELIPSRPAGPTRSAQGTLTPYARDAETRTLVLLDEAFAKTSRFAR